MPSSLQSGRFLEIIHAAKATRQELTVYLLNADGLQRSLHGRVWSVSEQDDVLYLQDCHGSIFRGSGKAKKSIRVNGHQILGLKRGKGLKRSSDRDGKPLARNQYPH